jgi:hypothetical protein
MRVVTHADAKSFLSVTQAALEMQEVANSLMLGVCMRMAQYPERIKTPPCLKTVEDQQGLVLAGMMTPPYKLVVFGHRGDWAEGARCLIESVLADGWTAPGVMGPADIAPIVVVRWAVVTGQNYTLHKQLRVFELRQVVTLVPARGRLRTAVEADQELVSRWWYEFNEQIFGRANAEDSENSARLHIAQQDLYLWDDPAPVSMAMTTRPTRHGISISEVYTPPELRRRGYATACVGELSRKMLREGWQFCSLFANCANPAANAVYEKIGYRPVGDYNEYVINA